jgi:mannose-1-phosphate guanylyltransferase
LIDFVGFQDLFDRYDKLEKISFNYGVLENEKIIEVMWLTGDLKDLGTLIHPVQEEF